jgi:hypothetical protein
VKEIKDIVELKTHDAAKKLSFATRYLVQINFTFDLTVNSDGFAGTSHFCVRIDEIETLCNDLKKMHSSLLGSAKLNDNDSDGFVEFTISENGHLQVCGQVGGSHEDHFVKFEFWTDQTCIPQFVDDFKKLLAQ